MNYILAMDFPDPGNYSKYGNWKKLCGPCTDIYIWDRKDHDILY